MVHLNWPALIPLENVGGGKMQLDAEVDMVRLVNDTFVVVVVQIAIKARNIKSQHGVASENGEPRHVSLGMMVVGDVQLAYA
jgi:hypothetical protein